MTRLLVFDSGVGGLSVATEIRREHPSADITYVADDAGFPYGEWEDTPLTDRVVGLIAELIGRFRPDAVVIACNTASTLVLPPLRARFDIPFVGTVPAIKPAAERTRSGVVGVLGTYGTIRRDYTRGLIESFAQDLPCAARRLRQPRALCRAPHARRAGGRRFDPCRDRAGLHRARRPADRHGRARLHALPLPSSAFPAAGAMAGRVDRLGAGDRAPRRGGHRYRLRRGGRRPRDAHVGRIVGGGAVARASSA